MKFKRLLEVVSKHQPRWRQRVAGQNKTARALFVRNGKFLAIIPDEYPVNLPGGHVEDGETLEDALVREVWEETRIEVVDARPLYVGQHNGEVHTTFLIHSWDGEPVPSHEGIPTWVDAEVLLQSSWRVYHRAVLEALLHHAQSSGRDTN